MINFHFMKGPLWSLPCLIPDTLQIISVWKSIYISFETHLPIPTGRILFTFFVSLTDSSGGLKCKTFCKMCSCKKSAKNLQKFCRFFCKFFAILLQFFCNCFANFLQNWFGIRIKGSHFWVNILLRGTTNPKIRGRTLTQVLHQNTQDFPISISRDGTPSVLMNVTKKVFFN